MTKEIPEALLEHILPFNWKVEEVWKLTAEVIVAERTEFDYLLELPLWSSEAGRGMLFDIAPIEVIRDPGRSPYQTQRLANTQLGYPLDFLLADGRRWILDGAHRLAKHYQLGDPSVAIRFHDESVIPRIRSG